MQSIVVSAVHWAASTASLGSSGEKVQKEEAWAVSLAERGPAGAATSTRLSAKAMARVRLSIGVTGKREGGAEVKGFAGRSGISRGSERAELL